jgi:hypothetical protein
VTTFKNANKNNKIFSAHDEPRMIKASILDEQIEDVIDDDWVFIQGVVDITIVIYSLM